MNRLIFLVCCLLNSLLMAETISASEVATGERVKIGLVLSGGGARGLAHVGVLKVLEQLRVPVDFVAGTSMGAIVGGLWASGMSATEIEEAVLRTDWANLFKDRPPRKLLSLHQKQLSQTYMADFELGYKKGRFHFPQGLIAGQQLIFLLRQLTLPVSQIEDFDRLPVPFRAVATDIVTGKPVILNRGSLPEAMRASMSIPGIFAPVEKEGQLLVDGGLVCNLPVEIVRKMGAEVIIAVDITMPLLSREKLNSLMAISAQVMDLMTTRNVQEQTASLNREKDILICPELGNISSMAFARGQELISLGEKAAQALTESLRRYSLSEEAYQDYFVRHRLAPKPEIVPAFVKVEGTGRLSQEMIKRKLSVRPGQVLQMGKLQQDIDRIYDLGEFELVDFHLVRQENQEGLLLRLKSKSWGPNYLRLGFNLYDDFGENNYYGVHVNYTWSQLSSLGAYWENQFELGKTMRYATELFLPTSAGRSTFLAPRIELKQTVFDFYDGQEAISEQRMTLVKGGLDFGWQLGQYGEVRLGLEKGLVEGGPISGQLLPPGYKADYAGFAGSINLDQLDRASFPHYGYNLKLDFFDSWPALGADDSYRKLSFSVQAAHSLGRHTLRGIVQAGTSLGSHLPLYEKFVLGGFFSLSGYEEGQLRGDSFGLGKLLYYYRSGRFPSLFGHSLYVGCSAELGNTWEKWPPDRWRWSGSLFVGADTFLGPVYLGHGQRSRSQGNTFFYLGRTF